MCIIHQHQKMFSLSLMFSLSDSHIFWLLHSHFILFHSSFDVTSNKVVGVFKFLFTIVTSVHCCWVFITHKKRKKKRKTLFNVNIEWNWKINVWELWVDEVLFVYQKKRKYTEWVLLRLVRSILCFMFLF